MYQVALTGGIGSGKSTATQLFAELGVPIIDADQISHDLTTHDSDIQNQIRAQLGEEFFNADGNLDRAALREYVFTNDTARKQLEAIMHPAIRNEMQQQIISATGPYCLLVIPLLVETGQQKLADRVITMSIDPDIQINRVMQRSGMDKQQVESIIQAQASAAERLAIADDVLNNNGDLEALRQQVNALHAQYLEKAAVQ